MTSIPRSLMYRLWFAATGRSPVYGQLKQSERLYAGPREEIDRAVRERLARVLRCASDQVPYYRRLFRSLDLHLTVDTAESVLQRLPILTKDLLHSEFDALRAEHPGRRARSNTSGGSTGEPAEFLQDLAYRNWGTANKLLFGSWMGYRPGGLLLKIWGAPRDILGGGSRIQLSLRSWMLNEHVLNCFRSTPELLGRFVGEINRLKPDLVEAYADAAYEFSRFVTEQGLRLHRPHGVITSAEVLLPHMKRSIEAAFGCQVLNRYGSREVGDIACSCPVGDALHVSELTHYLEILDEEGRRCPPGVEGNVVVTLLTNDTMPLIRYRIEDRAVWADGVCSCGRRTKRLAQVSGRRSDYLVASDGTRINGTALTTLLYGVPGIRRYQFRQTDANSLIFAILPADNSSRDRLQADLEPALAAITSLIGDQFDMDVRFVDDIPPTSTGKHRYVVNEYAAGTARPGDTPSRAHAHFDR